VRWWLPGLMTERKDRLLRESRLADRFPFLLFSWFTFGVLGFYKFSPCAPLISDFGESFCGLISLSLDKFLELLLL
jgi:hypothetical protein